MQSGKIDTLSGVHVVLILWPELFWEIIAAAQGYMMRVMIVMFLLRTWEVTSSMPP